MSKKIWQWIILLILAFIWGSSFILMKKGLESYNNYQLAALRMFIAYIILLPFAIKNLKKITRKNYKSLLIAGYIGNGVPALLYATAQTNVGSSVAGMLNSLTPLFTLIAGISVFRVKVKYYNIFGIIIGLAGSAGLVIKDYRTFFEGSNWYALLIVFATLFYGININQIKTYLYELDGVAIASLALFFVGPAAGTYLMFSDFSPALATEHYAINFLYIFILSLFSSVIAVIGFNILIKHTTAVFASSTTYIIPIFAIFWGFIDGESLSLLQLASICIVLAGVYLVNLNNKNNIH
ncbi:MAG: DMT family transporter [Bacteroidia bacterium]|nr:DMT family transporter [Bacteroidia bacterium]